jgi:hypothetical protein
MIMEMKFSSNKVFENLINSSEKSFDSYDIEIYNIIIYNIIIDNITVFNFN